MFVNPITVGADCLLFTIWISSLFVNSLFEKGQNNMAESAVAEEVVANGEEVGVIEGEELLARHRKEKKDLQG